MSCLLPHMANISTKCIWQYRVRNKKLMGMKTIKGKLKGVSDKLRPCPDV